MKVLSILFLMLVFFGLFAPTSTFAQSEYFKVTVTDAFVVCVYEVEVTETGDVLRRELSCDVNPEYDALLTALKRNRTTQWDMYYETTDGTERDLHRSTFDDSTRQFGNSSEIQTPALTNPDNFALQTTNPSGDRLNAKGVSAAASDRLFCAGTRNTPTANDYFSFVLNSEGIPTGAKSTIFSNPSNQFALGGSISADGGMAVQLTATSALWQVSTRLLKDGVPRKTPSSWTVPAYSGYSPDLTNTIEVNSGIAGASALKIRYLVYRVFRGVGTAGQQSQIVIQRIDDATGKPLEAAKPLTPFKNAFLASAEAFQSLAIAPNGELLIFTEYSGACKKMILKSIKLVNGAASGPAKVIAGCAGLAGTPFGYLGLNIAEDEADETP